MIKINGDRERESWDGLVVRLPEQLSVNYNLVGWYPLSGSWRESLQAAGEVSYLTTNWTRCHRYADNKKSQKHFGDIYADCSGRVIGATRYYAEYLPGDGWSPDQQCHSTVWLDPTDSNRPRLEEVIAALEEDTDARCDNPSSKALRPIPNSVWHSPTDPQIHRVTTIARTLSDQKHTYDSLPDLAPVQTVTF